MATVDQAPAPSAPLMSDAEAAWVRANVWPQGMRKMFRDCPGFWLTCSCQHECPPCDRGEHHRCALAEPLRRPYGHVMRRGGIYGAHFAEEYTHPTPTALGPQHTTSAQLWLADHACAWECRCQTCHPQPVDQAPEEPGEETVPAKQETAAGPAPVEEQADPDPDPEAVLALLRECGLADAADTVDTLTPAAFRWYAQQAPRRAAAQARRERQQRHSAESFRRSEQARRALQAREDRKEQIRAWAQANGYKLGRAIPPATLRAYEVAVEGEDGQPPLF